MRRRRSTNLPTYAFFLSSTMALNILDSAPSTIVPPQLDFDQIGNVGLVGDFLGISQIRYSNQSEMLDSVKTTSDDLIVQYGTGDIFLKQDLGNGIITSSCVLGDNETAIIVGNFTSIFNQTVPDGIAAVNFANQSLTPIPTSSYTTINGSNVNSMWCNNTQVYFGGSFRQNGSYGASVWDTSSNSLQLPAFGGFLTGSNISSIVSLNGSIIYGGEFSGIAAQSTNNSRGNQTELLPGMQPVSFNLANATGYGSKDSNGTSASSILCPMQDNSGWIAELDSTTGFIDVALAYTSEPTNLRLFNLADGSGTKTFRVVSYPVGSYMNLTYTDVDTGEEQSCSAFCPLPEYNSTVRYTDFKFVNVVPTTSMQIQLLDFYGDHPGLNGLQLFEQGQHAFANNELNNPRDCSNANKDGVFTSTVTSSAELIGDGWTSIADFMATNITSRSLLTSTYAQLNPTFGYYAIDRGQYEIRLYTPGCEQFGSCNRRGIVNVTVYPGFGNPVYTTLYQTNNDFKYDLVYNGTLQSGAYVRITPTYNNQLPMELVAFEATLNYIGASTQFNATNLFQYLPSNFTDATLTTPVGNTTINSLGYQLGDSAQVSSLALNRTSLVIGGSNFATGGSNLLSVSGTSITGINGVDGAIENLVNLGGTIFAQTSTLTYTNSKSGMSPITAFQGTADYISPFTFNGTKYFALSNGTQVLGLWNAPRQQFAPQSLIDRVKGRVSGYINLGNTTCYTGSLQILDNSTPGGSITLGGTSGTGSNASPYSLVRSSTGSLKKRDTDSITINGGAYMNSTHQVVIGKFNATLSDGQVALNALITDGNSSYALLGSNELAGADFRRVASFNGTVTVGGQFQGDVNNTGVQNIIVYNSVTSGFLSSQQPPPLGDSSSFINSVAYKPNSTDIIVGGQFSSSDTSNGTCNGVCMYELSKQKWSSINSLSLPSDAVVSSLLFETGTKMLLGGDFGDSQVAIYEFLNSTFTTLPGVPGPVSDLVVLSNDTSRQAYAVSGTSTSTNEPFLMVYDSLNGTWADLPNMPFTSGTSISSLSSITLQSGSNDAGIWPFEQNRVILVSGQLQMPDTSMSMAVFDGVQWTPMYSTIGLDSQIGGQINCVYAQKGGDLKGGILYSQSRVSTTSSTPSSTAGQSPTGSDSKHEKKPMAVGHVVGIACGIAVGCVIVLSALYLMIELVLNLGATDPTYQLLSHPENSGKDLPTKK